jgi:hypothetical protein
LLEKLSNKLAQEEEESISHNHRILGASNSESAIKLSIGPMFKINSESAHGSKGKPSKSASSLKKKTIDSTKGRKSTKYDDLGPF